MYERSKRAEPRDLDAPIARLTILRAVIALEVKDLLETVPLATGSLRACTEVRLERWLHALASACVERDC